MTTNEYSSPEDEAAARDSTSAHFAPPASFAGKELWPLTAGTRYYYHQACEREDIGYYRDLVFCFIHQRRGNPTVHADVLTIMDVLRDGSALRARVGSWLDELSGGDLARADTLIVEAGALRDAAFALERRTAVVATDADAAGQKKTGTQLPPLTTHSTANYSQPSTDSTPNTPPGNSPSGVETSSIIPFPTDPVEPANVA